MKKIIAGRKYDTQTARCVSIYGVGTSDRLYGFSESLYRKRNGEYFLYGEGGPGSKYSKSIGNGERSGREEITPMSYDEAQRWAEKHLDPDEYEAEFGSVSEWEGKVQLSLSVDKKVVEAIRKMAANKKTTMSAIVEHLVLN